ncbi:hypothetical protein B4113_2178 [Geobacillus sp. B4113_201601]|nr:hypothetical protein B4113_2178 [Geobacillus sp. B4113_201601]
MIDSAANAALCGNSWQAERFQKAASFAVCLRLAAVMRPAIAI